MLNWFVIKNLFQSFWNKTQVAKLLPNTELSLDNSVDKVVIKIRINNNSNDIKNKKGIEDIKVPKKVKGVTENETSVEKEFDLKIFKVINQENRIILVAEKNKILAMKQAVDLGHGQKMSELSAKDITKGFLAKKDSSMPNKRGII